MVVEVGWVVVVVFCGGSFIWLGLVCRFVTRQCESDMSGVLRRSKCMDLLVRRMRRVLVNHGVPRIALVWLGRVVRVVGQRVAVRAVAVGVVVPLHGVIGVISVAERCVVVVVVVGVEDGDVEGLVVARGVIDAVEGGLGEADGVNGGQGVRGGDGERVGLGGEARGHRATVFGGAEDFRQAFQVALAQRTDFG